jgi:D-glycero-alpha-D-manno-heptose-7-phosphate kinase
MIIARSPLRITLGGGGTDLPSYYQAYGGFCISAAIDKYVYVTVTKPFADGFYLKYSDIESVMSISDIKHPIIREALQMIALNTRKIEITTLADIPAGTGLGSSGSFTTALLKALYAHQRRPLNQEKIAKLACHIEIDRLGEPIGKQDQYIAAVGGVNCFEFNPDHTVNIQSLNLSVDTLYDLEDNLLLFFTGYARSASLILNDQHARSQQNEQHMIDNLHYIKELGLQSKDALLSGNTLLFGELMHEHWTFKKQRSQAMSLPNIDEWYELALKNGAVGGKLVGAGGGGFLMFMAHDRNQLRKAMANIGLEEVRFRFDYEGTKVVLTS